VIFDEAWLAVWERGGAGGGRQDCIRVKQGEAAEAWEPGVFGELDGFGGEVRQGLGDEVSAAGNSEGEVGPVSVECSKLPGGIADRGD